MGAPTKSASEQLALQWNPTLSPCTFRGDVSREIMVHESQGSGLSSVLEKVEDSDKEKRSVNEGPVEELLHQAVAVSERAFVVPLEREQEVVQ